MEDAIEEYPLGLSEDGKQNAYCIFCSATTYGDFRRNYAVCQHLIKGLEKGTLNEELYSDCATLIRKSPEMCAAKRMREREQKAGKSIFFVKRNGDSYIKDDDEVPYVPTVNSFNLSKEVSVSLKTRKVESKKETTLSKIEKVSVGGYADAINAFSHSESKVEVKVEAKSGESLIEMARRIVAAK